MCCRIVISSYFIKPLTGNKVQEGPRASGGTEGTCSSWYLGRPVVHLFGIKRTDIVEGIWLGLCANIRLGVYVRQVSLSWKVQEQVALGTQVVLVRLWLGES